MGIPTFALRAVVALLLGFLIGIERQWRQRHAGIRTYSLVALGAAMFVMLALLSGDEASPSRIPAQIVSGIGFIGAGVIFKGGQAVSGLNTASTIWAAAAVGSLAGYGFLSHASLGALLTLSINTVLRHTYRFFEPRGAEMDCPYRICIVCGADEEQHIRSILFSMLASEGIALNGQASEDIEETAYVQIFAESRMPQGSVAKLERMVSRIAMEKTVRSVRWETIA